MRKSLTGMVLACLVPVTGFAADQTAALPTPGFHHLHLNSTDPQTAIAFYRRQFPSTSKTTWAGLPALSSPNGVLIVFNKVSAPPPADPQATAFWHFGWNVVDERKNLEIYQARPDLKIAPLYTTEEGGAVLVNSDTWPGTGGSLGLTRAQIAQAKAAGIKPVGGAGFSYLRGPDNALIEYAGNYPSERFNHVHMYQEDPFCAQLWYQSHLNAQPRVDPGAVPHTYPTARLRAARSVPGPRWNGRACSAPLSPAWFSVTSP